MKTPKVPHNRRRSAFALVIVLGAIVLLVALAVGFLGRVTTERTAASGYSSAVAARQLGDVAVNFVQGQINMATADSWDPSDNTKTTVWCSQPGLITTHQDFNDVERVFKLYSAPVMVLNNAARASLANMDLPPADWDANPAIWTDLNAPVSKNGERIYPIVNPAVAEPGSPLQVEGFLIRPSAPVTADQEAPMPVTWLYVLQDGEMVSPTGSGNNAVVSGETADNPIVGRIGFWTDDETCKVNINTAVGSDTSKPWGTYWDTPRVSSTEDKSFLSDRLPVNREYQRFPGHPATVNLTAVFPDLTRDQLFAIAARYKDGGTVGGTRSPGLNPAPINLSVPNGADTGNSRLYASIDELAFTPERTATTGVTTEQVELARFFATAHNRSPELNMFGLPRISMWPVAHPGLSDAYRSVFDNLIARAATIGRINPDGPNTSRYYFQRGTSADSQSSTAEVARNRPLYDYLNKLLQLKVPFWNYSFSGAGVSGGGTYTPEQRKQVVVNILDYIRSTNISNQAFRAGSTSAKVEPYTKPLPGTAGINQITTQLGQVVPLKMDGKMGFGRFSTLNEAGIIFVNEAENFSTNGPRKLQNYPNDPPASDKVVIRSALLLEPFSVALGAPLLGSHMTWTVTGLDGFKISGEGADEKNLPLFAAGNIQPKVIEWKTNSYDTVGTARSFGGNGDIRTFGAKKPGIAAGRYPFLGEYVTVTPLPGGKIEFSGGTIEVKIYAGTGQANLIQTLRLNFPAATLPVPGFSTNASKYQPANNKQLTLDERLRRVGNDSQTTSGEHWINAFDVVRSVAVRSGDVREIANKEVVTADKFAAHKDYSTDSLRKAHSFMFGIDQPMEGAVIAKLVDIPGNYGGGNPWSSRPKYPFVTGMVPLARSIGSNSSLPNAAAKGRDFDNGLGNMHDGAYINKPDEGITSPRAGTGYFGSFEFSELVPGNFSPNRIIPSPLMLGSLPNEKAPWNTIRFHPPRYNTNPPQYLLADFFWMPIVEPYAISEPFSSAGKTNINFRIVPFSYIRRTTALKAAIQGEKFLAIPNSSSLAYKQGATTFSSENYRKDVDADFFISQIEAARFTGLLNPAKDVADITTYYLNPSYASESVWADHALTGDNSRERPYGNLYQKLTTKSNTYTVHFIAQALKRAPGPNSDDFEPGVWTEGKDIVAAEYRGSTTIERFVDANNDEIPNYLQASSLSTVQNVDQFYKWRIISNRQFAP